MYYLVITVHKHFLAVTFQSNQDSTYSGKAFLSNGLAISNERYNQVEHKKRDR